MDHYFRTLVLLCLVGIEETLSQVLDSATIHVPLHKPFKLKCVNQTDGVFQKVVWTSNAYSDAKEALYSYDHRKKEYINERFLNRIARYRGTSIRIDNAQRNDTGTWECNILYRYTPKGGKSRLRVRELAVYKVVIASPPVIKKIYPRLIQIEKNGKGSVYCDVRGHSPFNISWSKVNGMFSPRVKFTEWIKIKNGVYKIRKHMHFENFTSQDTGEYLCKAHNIGGKVMRKVNAIMQVRPEIVSVTDKSANIGRTVTLHCNATGYPLVTFTWNFMSNEKPISLMQGDSDGRFNVMRTAYRQNHAYSTLVIRGVHKEDWGIFTCTAENSIGYDERDLFLRGNSIPDAPSMMYAEELTESHVKLKWRLGKNGGKRIEAITIEYKQSNEQYWSKIEIRKPLTEYTIMNLKPRTYYDFQILTKNSIGQSDYSDVYSVETRTKAKATSAPKKDKNIFWNLNVIELTSIGGGVLLAITILIACSCLLHQERKLRAKKRENCLTKKEEEGKPEEEYMMMSTNVYS